MIAATPRLAVIAISLMTCTSINEMVMKPTESEARATAPGSRRRRKLARAASMPFAPPATSARTELTICTPWLTPDGEHQEGHQDGHRIDAEPERGEPAELPDHRDHGAGERRKRSAGPSGCRRRRTAR